MVEDASKPSALPSLATHRLVLRPVVAEDLELLVELNSDPAVMTYIRGRPASRAETLAEWGRRLERQSDAARGLGYWGGFEAGTFAGWWSASSFDGRPEVSGIGYRLRASCWGRGLATEGARAMIRQAFSCVDVDRVVASTMAVNAGSRRVLEKLEMTQAGTWATSPERQQVVGWECGEVGYELTRADWALHTTEH